MTVRDAVAVRSRESPTPAGMRLRGELLPLDHCPWLGVDWTTLERQADASPFASWRWVSTWLDTLPPTVRPKVFRASDDAGTVALALLVDAPEAGVARCFGRRTWHVQETGDGELDEITIEYGGLLAPAHWLVPAYQALFDVLQGPSGDWRRLRITTSAHGEAVNGALPAGMVATAERSRPCYHVDLASVRAESAGYAQLLGRKTRSSLRQALRAYRELGPLRAELAPDAHTALEWFTGFEDLHTRHWQQRGETGCFSRPYFAGFHRTLLARFATDGFARMTRITAGDALVGYHYNLAWNGTLYHYNAGMNYGLLPRNDRPGIVALHTVVEQAAADGWHAVDFLAGDQDYKRRLSTGVRALHSIDIRREGVRAAAERFAASVAGRATGRVPLARALGQPMDPGG